jgi:hypothetical protein
VQRRLRYANIDTPANVYLNIGGNMSRKKLTKASAKARQCAALRFRDPRAKGIGIGAALVLAIFGAAGTAQAVTCESLAKTSFPNTIITNAQSVPSGSFTEPDGTPLISLPASCRVTGFIRPTTDSNIGFELWMPNENWNHRYTQIGNGGLAGSVGLLEIEISRQLQRGYAVAGTDDGHIDPTSTNNTWALGHPEKVKDLAWRAVHVTSEISKLIISAFYKEAPRYSYFQGCSTGGKEAAMEAQMFPEDFDGIIAGSAAMRYTDLMVRFTWDSQAWLLNPASYIPKSKLPAVQAAALSACDALDGITDGIVNDPRKCHFDPAMLLCKAGDNDSCLTAPQVAALKAVYAGPSNPRTGKQIIAGYEPSGENVGGFICYIVDCGIGGTGPGSSAQYYFQNLYDSTLVFGPKFDYTKFDFDKDVATMHRVLDPVPFDATSTDLSGLQKRGRKLIQYQGWVDYSVAPLNAIEYYDSVVAQQTPGEGQGGGERRVGLKRTQDFYRLFMEPGMDHCAGGPGPNVFGQILTGAPANDAQHDVLTALEQWVEKGIAPDQIIATKYVNDDPTQGIVMQRPLCPYPQTAVHTGTGSTNVASSFRCVAPSDQGDDDHRHDQK